MPLMNAAPAIRSTRIMPIRPGFGMVISAYSRSLCPGGDCDGPRRARPERDVRHATPAPSSCCWPKKCAYCSKKTTGRYRTCASPGCPGLAWLQQQKRWKRSGWGSRRGECAVRPITKDRLRGSESLPGPLAIVVQGSALHANLGCFDGILRCELASDLKRDSSHLPVTSCVRCNARYTSSKS